MADYTLQCDICKQTKTEDHFFVVCSECCILARRKLTREQYKAWLIYNRARIANGLSLHFYDDTTVGDKDLYCRWGMCSHDVAAYPDPETWLYGSMTEPNGWDKTRIRVLDPNHEDHQWCPFDMRLTGDGDPKMKWSGCFWSCRIFQSGLRKREEALHWFDIAIQKAR